MKHESRLDVGAHEVVPNGHSEFIDSTNLHIVRIFVLNYCRVRG